MHRGKLKNNKLIEHVWIFSNMYSHACLADLDISQLIIGIIQISATLIVTGWIQIVSQCILKAVSGNLRPQRQRGGTAALVSGSGVPLRSAQMLEGQT